MFLEIETTHRPATDLGYLLHKHPGRVQTFDVSFGSVHVFYPEATEACCRVALLLDVDPVGLVRSRSFKHGTLDQYVNDRPWVASSFLSVALNRVFATAMNGRSKERPDLVHQPLPLAATIAVVKSRDGPELVDRLFQPLGYQVFTERHPLDERFPDWGEGPFHTVKLCQTIKLQTLLQHLYVLVPVLDNEKHYWVGDDEVEKLLARGSSWLPQHPEKDLIAHRYLKNRHGLARAALSRLAVDDDLDPDATDAAQEIAESRIEKPLSLNSQRRGAVLSVIKECGAGTVLDLGCGAGNLLRDLMSERQFTRIVGMDVSYRALERASDRLRLEQLPDVQRRRIELLQGSLMYRDQRLRGFDAAAVVEVIEHLDPPRLGAFERVVFEYARPGVVVITTPNSEFNVMWETLPAGSFRHRDHRFEWTRREFQTWAERVAQQHGYTASFAAVGPVDDAVGSPTQMAVFKQGA